MWVGLSAGHDGARVRLTRPVLEARSPLAMTLMEVGDNATSVSERKLKVGEPWQNECSVSAHSTRQPAGIRSALVRVTAV